jgi:hypothetical protein
MMIINQIYIYDIEEVRLHLKMALLSDFEKSIDNFISSKPFNEQGIPIPEGLVRSFANLPYSEDTYMNDDNFPKVELKLKFSIPEAYVGITFEVVDDKLVVSDAWGRQLMFGYGYVDFDFKQFAENMWNYMKVSDMFDLTSTI